MGILSSPSSPSDVSSLETLRYYHQQQQQQHRLEYETLRQQYPLSTTDPLSSASERRRKDAPEDCSIALTSSSSNDAKIMMRGGADDDESWGKAMTDDLLDPLTAMYMQDQNQTDRMHQLELKYRKEKALQKRGKLGKMLRAIEDEHLSEQEQRALSLQIIDKDLHRLPDPDELHGTTVTSAIRKEILREVLYIFSAQYHPYQQGMHEIASYVLYATELDGEPIEASDIYQLTSTILLQLLPAYDICPTTLSTTTPLNSITMEYTTDPSKKTGMEGNTPVYDSSKRPLEQMSLQILSLIAKYDTILYQTLQSLQVPPQLLFTKWVRLLFSREVTDVLPLWDVIFQHGDILKAAEALSASRLLVHRNMFLQHEQHDRLNLIMNMPLEDNIDCLILTMRSILRGETTLPIPLGPTSQILHPPTATTTHPTPSWTDPLSQAFQNISLSTGTTIGDTQQPLPMGKTIPVSLGGFSFAEVKERLTTNTKSLSKRLYQEWEQISANTTSTTQNPPSREQHYRQPYPVSPLHDPYVGGVSLEGESPLFSPGTPFRQLGVQMNQPITTLQTFAMESQRENRKVPDAVWEALASLEMIRQTLMNT